MNAKAEYCWKCGTLLVQGASFCKQCGSKTKLPESDLSEDLKFQYCSRCGSEVHPNAAFCSNCALELARPSLPSPTSPPTQPTQPIQPIQPIQPTTPPPIAPDPSQYQQPGMQMPPYPIDYTKLHQPVDHARSLSIMEAILIGISSLIIPFAIPGIVGWASWRGKYPKRARQALYVSLGVFAIYYIIIYYIVQFRPEMLPPELQDLLDDLSNW